MSKTFIPFSDYDYLGGVSTFMANLKNYMDTTSYNYESKIDNASVLFFPVSYDLNLISDFKRKGGKVVQRLDGMYYPSKHDAETIERVNTPAKEIYTKYADYIVFQSEYSKKQCAEILGEIRSTPHKIIINGVDKQIFYRKNTRSQLTNNSPIKFVTTGSFRNIDMLEPVILALDSLKSELLFELHVVGPITDKKLLELVTREYVIAHGSKDLNGVAEILRSSDVFVYSHLNPPCPNSVIEAVSTGLPVVGFDSGAMRELLYFAPELLASVSTDVLQRYEDFSWQRLKGKILFAVNNYDKYATIASENAHLYSFTDCARSYIDIFESLSSKNPVDRFLRYLKGNS